MSGIALRAARPFGTHTHAGKTSINNCKQASLRDYVIENSSSRSAAITWRKVRFCLLWCHHTVVRLREVTGFDQRLQLPYTLCYGQTISCWLALCKHLVGYRNKSNSSQGAPNAMFWDVRVLIKPSFTARLVTSDNHLLCDVGAKSRSAEPALIGGGR